MYHKEQKRGIRRKGAVDEQPDTVRKCESEGRSSFDYGIGNML